MSDYPNLYITQDDMNWLERNVYEPPMTSSDFKRIIYTQEQIEAFQKNPPTWKARFESENRWIGQVGEAGFRKYMEFRGFPIIDNTKYGASWVDFKYPAAGKRIEVKTIGTQLPPDLYYACDYDADQLHENVGANCFVFTRYVILERRVYLIGWIMKERFMREAFVRKAGVPITPSFTPRKDFYEIPISKLSKIEQIYFPAPSEIL